MLVHISVCFDIAQVATYIGDLIYLEWMHHTCKLNECNGIKSTIPDGHITTSYKDNY